MELQTRLPSLYNPNLASFALPIRNFQALPEWFYVEQRFNRLFSNLNATPTQIADYRTKLAGLAKCLNRHYWPFIPEGHETFLLAGSWIKGTPARASSDIDIIFLLPWHVKARYQMRSGNRQSDILQEVRNVLLPSYQNTIIKGDGPTVVVDFSTIKVEIAPAFLEPTGSRILGDPNFKTLVCHTKNEGEYRLSAPVAEALKFIQMDNATNGNLVALMRMAKAWKRYCNVPIKSIVLEQIAMDFLNQWYCARNGYYWSDWLMRDFLSYMLTRTNGWAFLPVTYELISFGNQWVSRTETALRNAINACEHERYNRNASAGEDWQKIFGTMIPKEA